MHRFFITPAQIKGDRAVIDGSDVAHIEKVLRLRPGDEVSLSDGQGMDYHACIEAISPKKSVTLTILSASPNVAEPQTKLTLFQGIPKGDKMETILQKCVETGICRVVPVDMARCVAKAQGANRLERWQRIVLEAAKQSGRGIVPEVTAPVSFEAALAQMQNLDMSFAAWEGERHTSLGDLQMTRGQAIGMLVGPEGGIDEAEVAALRGADIPTISLGPRILRTETAGPILTALTLYTLGEMRAVK